MARKYEVGEQIQIVIGLSKDGVPATGTVIAHVFRPSGALFSSPIVTLLNTDGKYTYYGALFKPDAGGMWPYVMISSGQSETTRKGYVEVEPLGVILP